MRVPFACVTALALAGLVAVGCGGGVTDPSQNKVETFSAVVQPRSSAFSSFTVARIGEYSVTLLSLDPPASVFVGAVLANFISGQCLLPAIQQNPQASPGHIVLSGSINPGDYCVAIVDQIGFSVPETYTIQVSHP